MWRERPFAPSGYTLEKAFSDKEVHIETDLTGVVMAPRCRIGMLDLQEGDLIVWGATCEKAGVCHCFLEKKAELYVLLSQYAYMGGTASLRKFQITNDKVMIKWNNLEHPKTCSWWRQETSNSILQCLP